MCIDERRVREIVRDELTQNNEKRDASFDEKFDKRFQSLKREIAENIARQIDEKIKPLLMLPEKCSQRGESMAVIKTNLENIARKFDDFVEFHTDLVKGMDGKYVTKDAFDSVKLISYGLVGAMATILIGLVTSGAVYLFTH